MSYYRPPDDTSPGGPAPSDDLAPGFPPSPFSLAPVVPAGPPGLPAWRDPADDPESVDDPADPGFEEEIWSVVSTVDDRRSADQVVEHLEAAGLATWVRADNEVHISTGMIRVYEVLVPEVDEARALDRLDEPIGHATEESTDAPGLSTDVTPEEYRYELRCLVDAAMPRSGHRARERAVRKALRDLDGAQVSAWVAPSEPDGFRRPAVMGMCVVLGLMVAFVVLVSVT